MPDNADVPSEAEWFPLGCLCPLPGCGGKATAAERWERGACTDLLVKPEPVPPPEPPPPVVAANKKPAVTLSEAELAILAVRRAEAGGVFRTSTRPTLNLPLLLHASV